MDEYKLDKFVLEKKDNENSFALFPKLNRTLPSLFIVFRVNLTENKEKDKDQNEYPFMMERFKS